MAKAATHTREPVRYAVLLAKRAVFIANSEDHLHEVFGEDARYVYHMSESIITIERPGTRSACPCPETKNIDIK